MTGTAPATYSAPALAGMASGFKNIHLDVLRVRVNPASAESDIIPTVEGTLYQVVFSENII